ncbi:extracellular solute-binding protein [Mesorhizobium sp. BR1-1-16]|uniref:ABC transporter substrate-binding protein n=1 Tax=Mesorhizobium sp. BR1-1-16 TaxID=2876653 RepID=UPI001CCF675A|nr:extracellular solute-binding protein [Mesorhizobium sp. BR1-1-16]MBZ9938556.1 extracellular solute-binding protein [Mesorhizobium sp. BR1-1-16]
MKRLKAIAASAVLTAAAFPALADTTLHVMSWQPAYVAGTDYWDKTVAGFEAENPGVKVESNFVAFGQYLPTLTAMIAAGSLPDVFNGGTKTGELGRSGHLVNFKDVYDAAFFDQFYAGPLRQYTFDDKPYGLPDMAQIFGVFANDRIMKEVGVEVPNTWDELIADVPKFKAAGYIPLSWGNLTRNTCPDFFLPLIAQYGGDVYALDDHTAPGLSWDSKPVVDALDLLQRLSKAGVFPEGINGIDDPQSRQLAYQGRAAMYFGGSWTPGIFAQDGTKDWLDNYSVHKVPALTPDGIHFTGDGAGEAWSVNADGPNKDLALKFIAYLYRPDVYNWRAKGLQSFPSMKSAVDQIDNPKVRTMISWIATDSANHILFGPGSWDAVSNVCQSALDGSISPADGAKKIEADVMAARSN